MGRNRSSRIAAGVALTLSVLYAPLWFTAVLALFFAAVFPCYYELVVAGIAIDLLYGTTGYLATEVAILVCLLAREAKRRLR